MGRITDSLRTGLLVIGVILALTVGLLLLAALVVVMRPLLVVAALVALMAGVVVAVFSPRFRQWLASLGQPQICYSGLRLATDVAVHPSHSWARVAAGGVAVGADDFVQVALGPVESVQLPPAGSWFKQGDKLFSLRRGNRHIEIQSPVSGTVIARNETLLDHPELVNKDPFMEGWIVRLRGDNLRKEQPRLLQGKQAQSWFRAEIDRLIAILLSKGAGAPSLADGGTLVRDFYRQIDDNTWQKLKGTFFSTNGKAPSKP